MKLLSLLSVFFLFISCGSPLDEDYWEEHNQRASTEDNTNDGQEVIYKMTLTPLYDFDISFSAESLKKLTDGRIAVSAEVNYPANLTLTKYTIEVADCAGFSGVNYNAGVKAQTSTFSVTKDLSAIAINTNVVLENQFIYLWGTVGDGTLAVRVACSAITR